MHFMTLHQSKGKEIDRVIISPNMGTRSYREYILSPDNEHRLFYVGVTRSKGSLVILDATTQKHYDFPRVK